MKKVISFLTITLLVLLLPLGFSALAKDQIYVDKDAKGEMDGSSDHPYDSIQRAIDKAKDKDKDVYIRKGTYQETLEVWEGVEIDGEDKDQVIIKPKESDDTVVSLYHKTALRNVTVNGGKRGVVVKEGVGALIKDCVIKNSKKDGLTIEEGKMKESRQVEVYDSLITDNDWNGIYSRRRIFILENNEITDNKKDGVEFSSGSEGTLSKNKIKDNGGDGIKLTLDGSKITVKKNSIKDNDREGLEVIGKGKDGSIWIRDNKFTDNDRWALAKVSKGGLFVDQINRGVVWQDGNSYYGNKKGVISPVIEE